MREAIAAGHLGQLYTYKSGNRLEPGAAYALDNGCVRIVDKVPVRDEAWSPERWLRSLDLAVRSPGCLFAAVPDWPNDTGRTDVEWDRWSTPVLERGLVAAYVAQDGCVRIPDAAGAVFLGGTTAWKIGAGGAAVAAAARASGRWLHMGRVNTRRRLMIAAGMRCDSVDGTTLGRAPDRNLPPLLRWIDEANAQERLDLSPSVRML